jgi:hypothetical protein
MRKRIRIVIGALTLAVALVVAVDTATARRLEVSEQRFLILFRGLSFTTINLDSICDVNLEGSFHSRAISKVSGQLVGYVTEAIAHHPCSGAEMVLPNGVERLQGTTSPQALPWQVVYLAFRGELPAILEINLSIMSAAFDFEAAGLLCKYAAQLGRQVEVHLKLEGTGRVLGAQVNEERELVLFESNSVLCATRGFLSGTGAVGTQREWRELLVRLVQ